MRLLQYPSPAGIFPAISALNPRRPSLVLAETRRIRRHIRNVAYNPPSASVPTAQSAGRVILAIAVCKKQADKWIRCR
jgi:hypothetical protein